MRETFLAWAAGFFDGEGCVLVAEVNKKRRTSSYMLSTSVTQQNTEPLELFKQHFGGNVVIGSGGSGEQRKNDHMQTWQWKVTGPAAYKFLQAIQPYVVAKADQVDTALTWPLPFMRFSGLGIPDAVREGRKKVMHELREIRAKYKVPVQPRKEKVKDNAE